MPSFLIHSRMSPELQKRILRSLRGDLPMAAPKGGNPSARRWFRLALVIAIVSTASWLTATYREQQAEIHAARKELIERWSRSQIAVTASSRGKSGDLIALVENEAVAYLNDERELETIREIPAILARPSIYLRLDIRDAKSEGDIITHSAEKGRDALLSCFVHPPDSNDEKDLVPWIKRVYSPEFRGKLDNFYPASHLFLAMTVMTPDFAGRIQGAPTLRELRRLDRAMGQAKLVETRPSLDAQILILALDEEKVPGTVTELDGASHHLVRLAVIDLLGKSVLFRTRRLLDPSSISEKHRARSANALTSCQFGAEARRLWNGDLRVETNKDPPKPPSTKK
jgi:hypothetical protein